MTGPRKVGMKAMRRTRDGNQRGNASRRQEVAAGKLAKPASLRSWRTIQRGEGRLSQRPSFPPVMGLTRTHARRGWLPSKSGQWDGLVSWICQFLSVTISIVSNEQFTSYKL